MLIRKLIGDLTFRTDIANGEDFLVYRLYRKVARISIMYELISECQWSKREILDVIEALQEKKQILPRTISARIVIC